MRVFIKGSHAVVGGAVIVFVSGILLFSRVGRLHADLASNGLFPWNCSTVLVGAVPSDLGVSHLVLKSGAEAGRVLYGERFIPAGKDAVDEVVMWRHQLTSMTLWILFSCGVIIGLAGSWRVCRAMRISPPETPAPR